MKLSILHIKNINEATLTRYAVDVRLADLRTNFDSKVFVETKYTHSVSEKDAVDNIIYQMVDETLKKLNLKTNKENIVKFRKKIIKKYEFKVRDPIPGEGLN